jgi:NADPH-dependent 2,4-dienoyl-CoA reductase/sulfur reductase-like enzyme
MKSTSLAILGAGPAGLAAASEAARYGIGVTIIDDNALPGGQYFRQMPRTFRHTTATSSDKDRKRAAALFEVLQQPGVEFLSETVVWDIPDEHMLAYSGPHGAGLLQAEMVLVSAGAYDRPVPFPGWTLPGVVTCGGLQNLLKGQRMIPGRRAVVAGNGPLLLVATATLLRGGAIVPEVVEAAPVLRRLPSQLWRLAAAPKIMRQAIEYGALMVRHGTRFTTGETVIEALGEDAVQEVVLAPIDERGQVNRARRRTVPVDTLVVGFGLRPSIELFQLLGCALRFDRMSGGWLPVRNVDLETSRPNVFAAGDGAGIGGVERALAEGRLVGMLAARRLGRAVGDGGTERKLRASLTRMDRFRTGLERLYRPPCSYLDLVTPKTTICRCEEVSFDDIETWRSRGLATGTALKAATRIGMGRCQGRNCLATLAELLAREGSVPVESVPMPRVRPPLRPVLIGDLLQEDLPPPPLPDDPHLPRGEPVS